ncbi:autotransporter outer membrane beta-barrel domain-containing protein [Campylobacter hyointestinalis]|uniref:autotransporter outer membrane beta-barrel domain-containing protein n=1 Tax=Campylobacter hyointestinalis TaxID=198 RepID=UPI00215C9E91|nr:autotransporter outer membrane beta-barrel domain-containing protein [Campylobacter hyointestinalis]
MKLSLIVSRAIFGLGVLGSVSICAQDITINSSGEIRTYFDIDQNQNLSIKDDYKNGDLTINIAYENSDLNEGVASEKNQDRNKLNIDLGENNLIFKSTNVNPKLSNYIGNVNFTAKTITLEDMHLQALHNGSVINGDTTISGKTDVFTNSNGEITINRSPDEFGSVVTVATNMPDSGVINGSLTINGNFNADKTYFDGFNVGKNYLNFNINGEANIKNSVISVGNASLNSLVLDRFVFASADKFNSDITTSNVASGLVMQHANVVISDKKLADDFIKEQNHSYFTPMDAKDFTDYKLSVDKSNGKESLIVSGGFSDKISDTKALLQFEIDYLKAAAKESDLSAQDANGLLQAKENATEIEKKVVEDFNKQIQAKQEIISKITSSGGEDSVSTEDKMGAMGIEVTDTTKYIFENTKNSNGAQKNNYIALLTTGTMGGATNTAKTVDSMQTSGNLNEAQGIFDSLINSNINAKVGIDAITNKDFFKDVRESAKNSTDILNNTSSANGAINISNDMALGDRIARLNNPYSEVRFANVLKSSLLANSTNIASDAIYDYYGISNYDNSVWANTFGGANIIDGESGGLYGISIGADKEFNENLLLGIYATYANSKIKDKLSVQESDNYQLGIYSSYRFNYSWELNSKLYGQIGDTKQDINLAGSLNNADFNRRFVGLNTNIGKVFNVENDLFLKPFVGVNYYYSYTPNYTETGAVSKNVESNTNNSLSLELGLESRKYFNESSYLFITPKIEQYVVNNGEDYVASFVGSNTSFSIKGEEKKKTYGQLIVGGNVSLNDRLSLDVGIGAKQILAGKVDSKNETYLSGNVGIKYKF